VVIKDNQTTLQLEIGKWILVIDDESDICFVLDKVLRENGFVVDSSDDPLIALENFKADLYALVILDIRMPELNGFELYREIDDESFTMTHYACITILVSGISSCLIGSNCTIHTRTIYCTTQL
jgi:CheY-like chemotaxis protein